MISYLGDFKEDATVYIMFNTFTSNDPSASCTITNFAAGDVHIHKDDGLGQRNNAAGITVSVDFDGITGSHMVKIDTSDNTVAGFWIAGHEYFIRIEGTTIDGATVNSVIGQFSIENRHNEVDVVKWLGTAAATPTVAGVPEVDMTHIAGGIQTVTDLKDFADAGYNPSNHKITGTADMRGTDNAALATTALSNAIWTNAKAAFVDHSINTVDTNIDTLLTRITATRAGYLDNLSAGAVALAAGVDLTKIHGVALTETVNGYLAAAFTKLFDVAIPLLVASEVMRGTDSAYTGTPPTVGEIRTEMEGVGTKLTNVLGDTDELQTNQGNWLTATGFSVPNEYNTVIAALQTDLDNPSQYMADISALALEATLGDIKGTGFIKDTHSLPQCLTATGFSVPNEYDTVIAALQTDLDNPIQYKADVSALATASALTTAQSDLDIITGVDGVTLATLQTLYAPNKVVPDVAGTAAGLHTTTDALINGLEDITIADIIAGIADGTYDLQEMMRIMFAVLSGKSSGGGTTTLAFRNADDDKNRLSETVDVDGNRTAVTRDGS